MENKEAKMLSRFFAWWQFACPAFILICACVLFIAHLWKGTMTFPGFILVGAMICFGIVFTRMSWKELREEYAKETPTK